MAKDNNFARVLKMTLPPTIARKLVTLTPLRSVRYKKNQILSTRQKGKEKERKRMKEKEENERK